MLITDVHMNSPFELRFTIVDGAPGRVRMVFVKPDESPAEVAKKVADNINHYFAMKAAGFPYDYNTEDHIAGILADAARYGCD